MRFNDAMGGVMVDEKHLGDLGFAWLAPLVSAVAPAVAQAFNPQVEVQTPPPPPPPEPETSPLVWAGAGLGGLLLVGGLVWLVVRK